MKKIILWLSLSILILSIIGCDCVRIKRLKQISYEDIHHNTHLVGVDKTVDMVPTESNDNGASIQNNPGDDANGNVDATLDWSTGSIDSRPDGDMGGATSHDADPNARITAGLSDTDFTGTDDSIKLNNIKLIVNVTADYPRGKLESNRIMLDGVEINSPYMTNSGQKNIEVSANGYATASKTINIPSGSTEHKVDVQLLARPRAVKFDFSNSKTGAKLTADKVIIGSSTVRNGGKMKPGKHTIEISKKGYQTFIGSITINPGTSPYIIRRKLDPENRAITRIKWIIYTEYPAQEEIPVPETVLLDGVEIEQGNKISSGTHNIIVKHPGHEPLRKTISVPRGQKVYTFKGTMTTLSRRVDSQIKYDISPPSNLGETSVALTSEKTGNTINIEGSTSVKPGDYKLKITKRGYVTISKTVRIYPLISPYSIEETLEAKPVVIQTQVNFDVNPPQSLGTSSVDFVGRNIRLKVRNGGSIKPGRYNYSVTLPGYLMDGNQKQINIAPSEEPYLIRESMNAQPRKISFDIKRDGFIIELQEIIIDGSTVSFNKTFTPGKQYQLVAKFKDYQTVEQTITIPPGSGPYVLDVPLSRK